MQDTIYTGESGAALSDAVKRIVAETPITDIHSHLYAPAFGDLLLWGVDDLLTYHYLIAEYLRVGNYTAEELFELDARVQANEVWTTLFCERSPLSESARGVLTVLRELELNTDCQEVQAYRDWFAVQDPSEHVDTVLRTAKIESVVMTNDPFDAQERAVWQRGVPEDKRFHAALRIDPLLNDLDSACKLLSEQGYTCKAELGEKDLRELRRFLEDWLKLTKARYMAVSLPPDFAYPDGSARSRVLDQAILPVARDLNLPLALMIGVRRQVNPRHGLAGDSLGLADVGAVEALCEAFPHNKFMCTMLARENQHALIVAARKFPNLMIFGCWWFLNTPHLIEDLTRMRVEMLGTSFIPQHSDARVLEQLIYKWNHSREIIGKVLAEKYADLVKTGWTVNDSTIERDVKALFGGNFWHFLDRTF